MLLFFLIIVGLAVGFLCACILVAEWLNERALSGKDEDD